MILINEPLDRVLTLLDLAFFYQTGNQAVFKKLLALLCLPLLDREHDLIPRGVQRRSIGYLLLRLRTKGNLAAAGVAGVGMMTRGIAVMLVAIAVAVSDPWLGLAAALTYAFAYTIELFLSLVSYFGNEPL